jgi:hypothetical protein
LKEEALDSNMWRDRFGRGFEPVVRLVDVDDDIAQTAGYVPKSAHHRTSNFHHLIPTVQSLDHHELRKLWRYLSLSHHRRSLAVAKGPNAPPKYFLSFYLHFFVN